MSENGPARIPEVFTRKVAGRLGALPNFFRRGKAAPDPVEKLWGFAPSAYLESPLPALLKKRLFVHLSRFCEARHCIVRHLGILLGEDRPASNPETESPTLDHVLRLLRRPLPDVATLDRAFCDLETRFPPAVLPEPETADEALLFDALTVIFLTPARSARARDAVRKLTGESNFEPLTAFLAFVRTAHYWAETHLELDDEPDMVALMDSHPELAAHFMDTCDTAEASSAGQLRSALSSLERTETALRDSQKAESRLRESEKRLVAVIEAVPIGIGVTDTEGRITLSNTAFQELVPTVIPSRDQIRGELWRAWKPDGTPMDSVDFPSARALRGETVFPGMEMLYGKEGGVQSWKQVSSVPLRNETGGSAGAVSAIADIDALKRSQEALRESEAKYRSLFQSIDTGYCVVEVIPAKDGRPLDYTFIEANPAFVTQTGIKDAIGKSMRDLIPGHEEFWFETYERIARTGRPERFEHRADAMDRWYSVYAFRVGLPGQNQVAILFHDVKDQRLRELNTNLLDRIGTDLARLTSPQEIMEAVGARLGEFLKLSTCLFVDVDERASEVTLHHAWTNGEVPDIYQTFRPTDSLTEDFAAASRAGMAFVVHDAARDERVDAANYARMKIGAFVSIPFLSSSRWLGFLAVTTVAARHWRKDEIELLTEVSERLFFRVESARAEAALRERESDLARVQRIGEVGGLNIDVVRGMRSRRSPEYLRLHGLPQDGREETHAEWRERLHPEDRERAERLLFEVLQGTAQIYDSEYRIVRPSDGAVRWIHARADIERDPQGKPLRLVGAHLDITEQKHMQEALREGEERQSFLLKLSDALGAALDPIEAQRIAIGLLGEFLKIDQVFYFRAEKTQNGWAHIVDKDFCRDSSMPARTGRRLQSEFCEALFAGLARGEPVVVFDVRKQDGLTQQQRQNYETANLRTFAVVPVIKHSQYVAGLSAQSAVPRDWAPREIMLIRDVAERIWDAVQRILAEAARRESEARFQQFADASSGALWIRDADTLAMEYASRAVAPIYGIDRDQFLGDVRLWAAAILPEDRDAALVEIEKARQGEAVVHEFRIQRATDGAFRWIRNTAFPFHDDLGNVRRIGGIFEDVTEAKLATEHQGVLLAELQHRVRNIMAIIRSITARTGERAKTVEEYAGLMSGRLLALSRVQVLLTQAANVTVGIARILRDEVSVQAQHEGQYLLDGPDVALSPKAAEILTLAVHELATNALKYGALSVPEGRIAVRWRTVEKKGISWLTLDWTEEGGPPPSPASEQPRRRGFGSELIEDRIPYELGGSGQVILKPQGATCHLEFPLNEGASVLETGAPQRATVFGGALDMSGETDLTGYRILVVEDEYYIATDAAKALHGAGAEVLGPCRSEEAARGEISARRPDAVLLDINLGGGPSFKLAEALKDSGIPFVFVTGYDQGMIPTEFSGIERLEKPVQLRQIVGAISKLLTKRI